MTKRKLLSVIIPAYKAEKSIYRDILYIKKVLEQISYDYEIIVVVDGKEDDKTFENVSKIKFPKIKVVGYQKNHGKGYAVRYGTAKASGDPIVFLDAGSEIDPNGISMALEHMRWYNADIIVGSKRHPASEVSYPFPRRVLSILTQSVMFILFGLQVRDTQVGLKMFRREVLEKVLPRLLLKRFAFDVEWLVVAKKLGYKRIFESPVKISHKFPSTVKIFGVNSVCETFFDTMAVFYRLKILRYYDDSNKRKWRYDPDLNLKINVG